MTRIEHFMLHENGWVPNNERLPVLYYRCVLEGEGEATASRFERRFAANLWPPQWRDTIYDYHHYHSTAHEVLGMARGTARLMLGGEGGHELEVCAGDALLLPVGTGHRRIEASEDFLVVGAYPQGQEWDICRHAPSDSARRRMNDLPNPALDPIEGQAAGLVSLWSHSKGQG